MKKKIFEEISWIPYKVLNNLIKLQTNPLEIDLRKIEIPEKIILYYPYEDEGLSRQIGIYGFREPLNWKTYYYFVDKNDIVLDIGANIGLFSILSKRAKKIVSIEPINECIPFLKMNLSANNLEHKSIVLNMAVSGDKKELYIKKENHINLSRVVSKPTKEVRRVKSEKLKYFVQKYKANLIRIDVEGYEYKILYKNIPKKVNKIAMEFHAFLLGEKKVKKLLSYFEEEGFMVKYFIEDLPLRLYPFYKFLKKTGLIKGFTYIKESLNPIQCLPWILRGRQIKYLFLVR